MLTFLLYHIEVFSSLPILLTNERITEVLNNKLKKVVIFSQLLFFIIAKELKPARIYVHFLLSQAVTRYFMICFGNSSKTRFVFFLKN